MKLLSLEDLLEIHRDTIEKEGGLSGIRDMNVLLSAVDQPRMTAFGIEAYPSMEEKAVALSFSLIKGHGFADGNKRTAFIAFMVFLQLNGYTIDAGYPEDFNVMTAVASGQMSRDDFVAWVHDRILPIA